MRISSPSWKHLYPASPLQKTSAGTAIVPDILSTDPTQACGALSAALPVQESMPVIRRHKRAATMLDGSQPPEVPKDQQPITQPNTPVKRSLWGSRAAPPPEPAGPSPYAECDPFDVTLMR